MEKNDRLATTKWHIKYDDIQSEFGTENAQDTYTGYSGRVGSRGHSKTYGTEGT